MVPPFISVEAIDRTLLNAMLTQWGHRMGPLQRPVFAFEAHHALFHNGEPVAVTASGETVREVVGKTGIRRDQCVELVRLCAERPHLCRAILRLWREFIFPAVAGAHGRSIAVSYQDAALHGGNTYRFDGWQLIGKGGGGGQDSRTGRQGRDLNIWRWPPVGVEP